MTHPRRTFLLVGAAMAAGLTLTACSGGAAAESSTGGQTGTIEVVATTNVYADIAQAIGGSHVSVHAIISKPGADPHGYEATAQDKLAVSKARIGIENGGGYDDFFDQLAKGQLDAENIVNASKLSGLDTSADFNEHLWYSMPVMSKLVDELANRFSTIAPEHAADFAKNAKAYQGSLTALEGKLATLKGQHSGQHVAITEPVPLYLLEDAGLSNSTPAKFSEAVENGTDAPAAVVSEMKTLLASGKVELLAYNEQTESPQTRQLKEDAAAGGLQVVDFSETLPPSVSFLDWMESNVKNLEQALNVAASR